MTLAEVYEWAIAWAQREALRHRISWGETPIHAGHESAIPIRHRSPENAGIRHDEHAPRIAGCLGKRIDLATLKEQQSLFDKLLPQLPKRLE